MKKEKLPEDIQKKLNEWFGEEITPTHFWKNEETFYVVVLREDEHDQEIYFLRLWRSVFNYNISLSVDNEKSL